jgi:hypothetical protein
MENYANRFMVSAAPGGLVLIMNPPHGTITPEYALLLAAWLVAIAEPKSERSFKGILEEVKST